MTFKQWAPHDWIVGILAVFLSVFLITMITGIALQHRVLDDEKARMVYTIIMSITNLISLYIGAKVGYKAGSKNGGD